MSKGKRPGGCSYFLPSELVEELEEFLGEHASMDYVPEKGTKPNRALELVVKLREATEER